MSKSGKDGLTAAIPKVTVIERKGAHNAPGSSQTGAVANTETISQLNNILLDVNTLRSERDAEAKSLRELNEKLGNYLEKSRFYELQKKRLEKEIEDLKDNMGKEAARIRKMYETELKAVNELREKSEQDRDRLERRYQDLLHALKDAEDRVNDEVKGKEAEKQRAAKNADRLRDLEGELLKLRSEIQRSEEERNELKSENGTLREKARDLRADVDQETLNFLNAKNVAHALKEELEFFKNACDQERKDLQKLGQRDPTLDARAAWKSEIGNLFRELHDKFDTELSQLRNEVESQFKMKTNEIRTNQAKGSVETAVLLKDYERLTKINTDLKSRLSVLEPRASFLEAQKANLLQQIKERQDENAKTLGRLRDELKQANEEIKRLREEIKKIMDAKVSLEMEIAQYRRLLEIELGERKEGQETGKNLLKLAAGGGTAGPPKKQ